MGLGMRILVRPSGLAAFRDWCENPFRAIWKYGESSPGKRSPREDSDANSFPWVVFPARGLVPCRCLEKRAGISGKKWSHKIMKKERKTRNKSTTAISSLVPDDQEDTGAGFQAAEQHDGEAAHQDVHTGHDRRGADPEPEASDTATARPKPLRHHRRDQHGHHRRRVDGVALSFLVQLVDGVVRDALHAHARLLRVRLVLDVSLTCCFSSRACLLPPPPPPGLMVRANCTPCSASSFAASTLPILSAVSSGVSRDRGPAS